MSVSTAILDIVLGAIHEIRGTNVDDWATEKVAAAIADKVKESIAATIAAELRVYANALGLVVAADELAEAASKLLRAMREAETGGSIPKLGLDVEVVSELPKSEPEQ